MRRVPRAPCNCPVCRCAPPDSAQDARESAGIVAPLPDQGSKDSALGLILRRFVVAFLFCFAIIGLQISPPESLAGNLASFVVGLVALGLAVSVAVRD